MKSNQAICLGTLNIGKVLQEIIRCLVLTVGQDVGVGSDNRIS